MNTQVSNNVATIRALISKGGILSNDNKTAIHELLDSIATSTTPAKVSESVIAEWRKAISEKGGLVDSQDFTLIHVPAYAKYSRTLETIEYEAVDIKLNIDVTDSSLRLASNLVLMHKRANVDSSQVNATTKGKHLAYQCKEALDLINGVGSITDLLSDRSSNSGSETDYTSALVALGLTEFSPYVTTWGAYYDGNNSKNIRGITASFKLPYLTQEERSKMTQAEITTRLEADTALTDTINANCDKLEALCTPSTKKNEDNIMYYTAKSETWEIIRTIETSKEGSGRNVVSYISEYKYQFRPTKAK